MSRILHAVTPDTSGDGRKSVGVSSTRSPPVTSTILDSAEKESQRLLIIGNESWTKEDAGDSLLKVIDIFPRKPLKQRLQ